MSITARGVGQVKSYLNMSQEVDSTLTQAQMDALRTNAVARDTGFISIKAPTFQATNFELRATKDIYVGLSSDWALSGFVGGLSGYDKARNIEINIAGKLDVADGKPFLQGVAVADWKTGKADVFDFGEHQVAEEMVFVPRPGARAEMDGWLVGTSVNLRARATELHVFDAGRVSDGPVVTWRADLALPHVQCSRLAPVDGFFTMQEEPGEPNSGTRIELLEQQAGLARYRLTPVTGKRHQLRAHMNALGLPLLGDRFYPRVLPAELPDDAERPLQLLAQALAFDDPFTGESRQFRSQRQLLPLSDWAGATDAQPVRP